MGWDINCMAVKKKKKKTKGKFCRMWARGLSPAIVTCAKGNLFNPEARSTFYTLICLPTSKSRVKVTGGHRYNAIFKKYTKPKLLKLCSLPPVTQV